METLKYRITLDLLETTAPIVLKAMRFDTNCSIIARLTSHSSPYKLGEGSRAVLAGYKPDGTFLYNHCTILNDTIIYDFTTQTTTAVGVVECEFRLFAKNGAPVLTSPRFSLLVEDTIYGENDFIESTDERNVLAEFIKETTDTIEKKCEDALAQIEAEKAEMLSEIEMAANIVQTTGGSKTAVMSQNAVTEAIASVNNDLSESEKDATFITSVYNESCTIHHGKYASYTTDENGKEIVQLYDVENSGVIIMECKLGESIRVAITTPIPPYNLACIITDENDNVIQPIMANNTAFDDNISITISNAKVYFNFTDEYDIIPAYIKKNTSSKLAGKKIACFGDSITWYDGQVYNWGKESGQTVIGYESYLRQMLDMHVHNFGLSGHTMPMILERAILNPSEWGNVTPDFSIYDYITITSGANDERLNVPLGEVKPFGSVYDTSTYIGALQMALDYILSINKDVKILLCTPIMGWIYAPDGYGYERTEDGIVTEKWSNAIKEVAKMYSLPVCDWYNESGINLWTRINYMNDPEPVTHGGDNIYYSLHPTTSGYKRMADLLMGKLKAI